MKEKEFEQLMEKICRESVEPPEYLVNDTIQRLRSNFLLKLVTSISLFLNALVMVGVTAVFFLPGISLIAKISWYFMITTSCNALIVLVLLNREKVILFFDHLSHKLNKAI